MVPFISTYNSYQDCNFIIRIYLAHHWKNKRWTPDLTKQDCNQNRSNRYM